MTIRGAVSFVCDPTTKITTGPQFVQYLQALGVTHVKAPIRTSATNTLPTSLYVQAINVHRQAGIPVLPLFDRAFRPTAGESADLYPNMPLNTTGNRLLSPWIDGYTLRAQGFLRQLRQRCGVSRAIVWNEANLAALVAPGVNADPGGGKANALSPQVFGALCWQAATRWKAAGIKQVYCGGLSILPQGGTDRANPYGASYVDHVYLSLEARGYKAPWPWAGWCVNAEGWWSAQHFAAAIGIIRLVMATHLDMGGIIVGEWGTTCDDLRSHPDQAASTYAAIRGVCPESYFFQAPGKEPWLDDPAKYGGYGAHAWRNAGDSFIAGPPYAWYPVLQHLFQSSGD